MKEVEELEVIEKIKEEDYISLSEKFLQARIKGNYSLKEIKCSLWKRKYNSE